VQDGIDSRIGHSVDATLERIPTNEQLFTAAVHRTVLSNCDRE
jgi:hypothetical protein